MTHYFLWDSEMCINWTLHYPMRPCEMRCYFQTVNVCDCTCIKGYFLLLLNSISLVMSSTNLLSFKHFIFHFILQAWRHLCLYLHPLKYKCTHISFCCDHGRQRQMLLPDLFSVVFFLFFFSSAEHMVRSCLIFWHSSEKKEEKSTFTLAY